MNGRRHRAAAPPSRRGLAKAVVALLAAALIAIVVAPRGVRAQSDAAPNDDPLPTRASAHRVRIPPKIDGSLDDWNLARLAHDQIAVRSERQVNRYPRLPLGSRWSGPDDLSATFFIAYDARALYVAGRVKDDVPLHRNNTTWWLGDAIELFLDTDLTDRTPDRGSPSPYDTDDFQIFLMPLNAETPWGVFKPKPLAREFSGVRVASALRPDGWDFEAAFPWHNFPGLVPKPGTEVGFNVALDDLDVAGETETETYMVWNGQLGPSETPDRFGTLVLLAPSASEAGGEPADLESDEPILDLLVIVILISGLVAAPFAANVLLRRVSRHPMRRKTAAFAVIAALLAVTWALPPLVRTLIDRTKRSAFESRLVPIGKILDEVRSSELLDPSSDSFRDDLERLLRGDEVAYQESYSFRTVRIGPPPPILWTEQGIPFEDSERGVLVTEPGRNTFLLEEGGEIAETAYVVYSVEPRDGYRSPPQERLSRDHRIGSFRLVFANQQSIAVPLEAEVNADYGIQPRTYTHPPTWSPQAPIARTAALTSPPWPVPPGTTDSRRWVEHSHQLSLDVPRELSDSPILSIEYVHESTRDAVRILGLATSNARRNPQLSPVSFKRPSLTGVPIRIFHDVPKAAAVVPGKGNERGAVIPINATADRLWFVYSASNTFPHASGSSKFESIGSIVITTRGEKESQHEIPLVAGENVDDRRSLVDGRHAPDMRSRVAQVWTDADGATVHQDILEYAPGSPDEITQVAIRDLGGESSVRLSAITLGTINPGRRKSLSDLATIAPLEPGRAALAADARAAIRDLSLSVVKEKLLAESTTPSPTIRWDESKAGRFLTAFLPVDPDKAPDTFLEVTDPSPGPSPPRAPFTAAKVVLLALLLPLGLVLVTDVLDRSPRLRVKLVVTFGLVSVLPLVVFFFALSRTVGRHVEESIESKLESHRLDAERALDVARRTAQTDAELFLRDSRLNEILAAEGPHEIRAEALRTRLGELRRERLADQPSAWILLRDHEKTAESPRLVETVYRSEPPPQGFVGLGSASAARRSDIVAGKDGVLLLGVASTEGKSSNRFQRLVVVIPLDDECLRTMQRALKGAELTLLSPRGETLATTLSPPPEATERRIAADGEAIRQSLSSGPPPPRVAEHPGGEYLVAYDRIRDADGRTAAAMSVAVPRTDLLALEDQIRRWFAIVGSVVFLLVIVVGSLMTAKITVPIERLGKVTAEISRGNLQCEVPIGGPDEVGDLTRAFGTMTTDLRARIQQLHELNRGIQALNETLDPAAIVGAAAEALQRASGADGVVIARRDPNRESLQVLGGIDRGAAIRPFSLPIAGNVAADVLSRSEALAISYLRQDERFRNSHPDEQRLLKPYGALLGLPLIAGGETRAAALLLWRESELDERARSREFLGTLASQVTIALENARLYQLAVRDPLSGLHVHSYFAGRLKEEIDRAQRSKSPLSVIRLDVDGLVPHRDSADRDAATETLRDVARTIRATLRRMCVAARSRDASFEILLPETEKREALRIAERLRRQVDARLRSEDRPRRLRELPQLACAAGAAGFPEDGTSLEFLLNAAEIALEASRAARLAAPKALPEPHAERRRPPGEVSGADRSGRNAKTVALLESADRIAQSAVTVLIQGETGVGKEVLAERIHRSSPRRDRTLVKVNCSAFPETLLESELFGHEKGAFTGADHRKIGRFEHADGGTLFLDEIGELSPSVQVKLLRVIQDRTFERLGSSTPITVDVRIIAATNRNLVRAIQTGAFREDLYYRLNVAPIVVPPLRERKEEIPSLVDEFIRQWNEGTATGEGGGKKIRGISPEALDLLFHHAWPGNVRELKNAIERAMVVATGNVLGPSDFQFATTYPVPESGSRPDASHSTAGTRSPASDREVARAADSPADRDVPAEFGVESELNPRQVELLGLLQTRGGITTAEYVTLLQVSERTGLRDLTDLVRRRILSRVGRTKGAVYRLVEPQRRA